MPLKNNKPYVRWDVRKALEKVQGDKPHRARISAERRALRNSVTSCKTCGKEIRGDRKVCSDRCRGAAGGGSLAAWERAMSALLTARGWTLYSPTGCCDRIGIKDGRVFFIEFKPESNTALRPGQQAVRSCAPRMFRMVVGKPCSDPEIRILEIRGPQESKPKSPATSSQFKGVYKVRDGLWRARFSVSGKRISLGDFDTEEDAFRACIEETKRRFGVRESAKVGP